MFGCLNTRIGIVISKQDVPHTCIQAYTYTYNYTTTPTDTWNGIIKGII